ncbi:hypothetical protein ACHAXA_007449 [Cyclostephanos tholiformis]|uniref:tRNA/rRNA methyltransferase SpoU type domain-containing protein n=1 Tax=Cyclostephanos tholiformis TaxID=382380 RepID=A0ABD3R0E7_9STRA
MKDDYDDWEEEDDDDVEEDDAAFLRRASSVHDALLLSLSLPSSIVDGGELARSLVEAVLLHGGGGAGGRQRAADGGVTTASSSPTSMDELASLISSLVFVDPSSSSYDRRRRMRMSRSLLVACLNAVQRVVVVVDDANYPRQEQRRIIDAACRILVRIHDDVHNDDDDGLAMGAVRDVMHRAIVALLRGIVVCRDREADDGDGVGGARRRRPSLSLGALRPISGILLPTLYLPEYDEGRRTPRRKTRSNVDEIESLWSEILTLLREYDGILLRAGGGGGRGGDDEDLQSDDRNYDAAPIVATAMLCIVLPTFRAMDLPSDVIVASATSPSSPPTCRPIYQRRVWNLIRHCMGRCGGSRFCHGVDGAVLDATGGGGGRGTSLLSRPSSNGNNKNTNDFVGGSWEDEECSHDRASMDQLLRRRSAHALRLMLEHERSLLLRNSSSRDGSMSTTRENRDEYIRCMEDIDLWMKYVLCFEMLEMETELHLVEQVWTTVAEITSAFVSFRQLENGDDDLNESPVLRHLPRPTWGDIGSLLRLVLLSEAPTMRKLGLYRFLSGHTGVNICRAADCIGGDISEDDDDCATFMNRPKSRTSNTKKIPAGGGGKAPLNDAPLSTVPLDFIFHVVMRSFDSIVGTKVGDNMQIEEGGQQKRVSIADLLSNFLTNYTLSLAKEDVIKGTDSTQLSKFLNMMFGPGLIPCSKAKSLMLYYRSVVSAIDTMPSGLLNIDPDTIQATIRSLRAVFSSGGAPKTMQEELRLDLALVLKSSIPWKKVDPYLILQVLAMYPPPDELVMMSDAHERPLSKARDALGKWLVGFDDGGWAKNVSSSCASSFVSGQLMPFGDTDILSGVNMAEREIGMSVCIFCLLSGGGSELLWPAVFKGLTSAATASLSSISFYKANRALILLEYGCKEHFLSGMGNGDILLRKFNETMLPPPPNIDLLLGNAAQFIMSQLISMSIKLFETEVNATGGSTRSGTSNSSSAHIAILVGQLRVLHLAYPSSISLSQAVDNMLEDCVSSLAAIEKTQINHSASQNCVKFLTLCYAALSCGASFAGDEKLSRLVSTCHMILNVELSIPPGVKNDAKQACRSIFQYAKWGALSLIVSNIMQEAKSYGILEVEDMYQAILASARDSVNSTPAIALPPLFECALGAGNHIVMNSVNGGRTQPLLCSIHAIVETLFGVLNEETSSSTYTYMLNAICRLLFREKLLFNEYMLSYCDGSCGPMPIRDAFQKLLQMAGTSRPYICKTVVSRIAVAWLGCDNGLDSDVGMSAIPYRDHIVDLLVFKECRFDEGSAHAREREKWDNLPEATDSSSITRAFVLSFLSKLPPPENMSNVVLTQLAHVVIMKLLDICCTSPARGKAFISGSETYAQMIRGWQALCLMCRFVTDDIASKVAFRVFNAMGFTLHGQIRYFIEVFTIQCTRVHSSIFGQILLKEVRRSDLSLPHVSTLLIIGGNLTVGRYSSDFFHSSNDPRLKETLCGVLPWLSSTQGFSRAISQLLCHKLIPLVVDVHVDKSPNGIEKDDVVLRSIYFFLENNTDMSRLREKQKNFFDTYDVDTVCSLNGILSMPVDEGGEANPTHMADAIKDCLEELYKEAHNDDAPVWKQMEDLLLGVDVSNPPKQPNDVRSETDLVNFQRKILPIDSLDLGIRSFHEQRFCNAAGKKKQKLIVCATLIDKVPNLAGLARTCEIFSAQMLVIHNLLVKKQDDFKSISASVNDWIEMEECKKEDLLSWLFRKKSEGFSIIGVEQTASSKCLTNMAFPEKCLINALKFRSWVSFGA